jgi:hypothetical protein
MTKIKLKTIMFNHNRIFTPSCKIPNVYSDQFFSLLSVDQEFKLISLVDLPFNTCLSRCGAPDYGYPYQTTKMKSTDIIPPHVPLVRTNLLDAQRYKRSI